MIERVYHNEKIMAVILRRNYSQDGTSFFTPDNFSQQLGCIKRPAGDSIPAHVHNHVLREVVYTEEVLFIKKGKIQVDLYDEHKKYLESKILHAGDVMLLGRGGHGFEVLEDVEIIEVKQGPYVGVSDKTRFDGIKRSQVVIK